MLAFFGISVHRLRAAAGVIVLLIGLHMLFNKSEHKTSVAESEDAKARDSIAVVPLAIPLVAGPGTIATVLVAAQRHPGIMAKVEISIPATGSSFISYHDKQMRQSNKTAQSEMV